MNTSVILRHRLGILACTAAWSCFDPIAPVDDTGSSTAGSTDGVDSTTLPILDSDTTNPPVEPGTPVPGTSAYSMALAIL